VRPPAALGARDGYAVAWAPTTLLEHLELNHDPTYEGKPNPLARADVRLALALALDKGRLIHDAWNPQLPAGVIPGANSVLLNLTLRHVPYADLHITGQWDPIARRYVQSGSPRALADAKKLISSGPYAGGFALDVYALGGDTTRAAEVGTLTQDWARIGVAANVEYLSSQNLYGRGGEVWSGAFQVALFASDWGIDAGGLESCLASRYGTRGQEPPVDAANYSNVADPGLDAAFARGRSSSDARVREQAYVTVQREVNHQAHWIPLGFHGSFTVHSRRIRNFTPVLWTIADWTLARGYP
jgi:ABC-type transport system substrate-binding protein